LQDMQAKAIAKYVRISPQKVSLVIDLIRGKRIEEAETVLKFTEKKAAQIIGKLLKSAVANAAQNPNMDESVLYVKEAYVGPGPTLKRWRSRAQGRVAPIRKKTSNITVIVAER